MTILERELTGTRLELGPGVFVAIRSTGLTLPVLGEHPALPLDLAELRLLEALARGDDLDDARRQVTDETGADLERLVDALQVRGLLSGSGAAARTPLASDERVDAEPVALRDTPDKLVVAMPLLFWLTPDGFTNVDHERRVRAVLDAVQLSALAEFHEPARWLDGITRHRATAGRLALRERPYEELVDELGRVGLLLRYDPTDPAFVSPHDRIKELNDSRLRNAVRVEMSTDRLLVEHDREEAERTERTGTARVVVHPVQHNGGMVPLGLGMVIAYAQAYEDGRLEEHYNFRPDWVVASRDVTSLGSAPGVFLFSNYVWSHAPNLEFSERVKAHNRNHLTIHGGPDSPKYTGDVANYFAVNPHIDVIVHGEGEVATAELLEALIGKVGDGPPDLSELGDLPGVSYRLGDRIISNPDKDRIADLDTIPSPLLSGLFQAYADAHVSGIALETNRGCPYGCTFCDWGSATLSRIRKFDLDRVFAEIEWCGQNQLLVAGVADANFGIFERDVAIAEKFAEVKLKYGYPTSCFANYAKNTTKHLQKIVQIWVEAGIITNGLLSLQSVDDGVLAAVKRKNIKVEKYNDLAAEFHKAHLPLFVDMMMGLPGATTESFQRDLQDCIEREVVAKIHPTTLLSNSPMNEPAYREEYQIEVAEPRGVGRGNTATQLIVASSTFTRDDMREWKDLRRNYLVFENFGVLRQVSRYVRQQADLLEIDFYVRLRAATSADPGRWPVLRFTLDATPDLLAPPVSWGLFLDEVRDFIVEEFGVPDDDALDTVLRVQHALLPARERELPITLDLAHDYAAWHAAMSVAKQNRDDWPQTIPHLRELPPAPFTVHDTHRICGEGLGYDVENGWLDSWEMESPVSRPIPVRMPEL